MLKAFKEMAEGLGGSGVNLAARAITGVVDLVRSLAAILGDQLGLGGSGRSAAGWGRSSVASEARMIEPGVGVSGVATAMAAKGASAGHGRAAVRREATGTTRAGRKGPARARAGQRRGSARKARATKKAGVEKDQLVRVLRYLSESSQEWMSASELSAAAGSQGAPMLPGNVRKVIRLRGNDLVETRPRAGSRRGSLEYRMTSDGRRWLQERDA